MSGANPRIIALSKGDDVPELACDRGVSLVPPPEIESHAPDRVLLLADRDSLVARCSCWWNETPLLEGARTGLVGHYAAADPASGFALLEAACAELRALGAVTAVGPMDGNTWRRYRFIVERGPEPTFFLEPDNPDDWPAHWTDAGFTTLATYTSALNDVLDRDDRRTDETLARLAREGVTVRAIDATSPRAELRRLFVLSLAAFGDNFLYTPIREDEFLAQYEAVLPYVRPELVLLAERADRLAGFIFALPDLAQARRGAPVDTVILKTLAVDPSERGVGLGGALLDLAQRTGRELGFRRAIHALMHETNVSGRISARYARTIRRYALFSRRLPR